MAKKRPTAVETSLGVVSVPALRVPDTQIQVTAQADPGVIFQSIRESSVDQAKVRVLVSRIKADIQSRISDETDVLKALIVARDTAEKAKNSIIMSIKHPTARKTIDKALAPLNALGFKFAATITPQGLCDKPHKTNDTHRDPDDDYNDETDEAGDEKALRFDVRLQHNDSGYSSVTIALYIDVPAAVRNAIAVHEKAEKACRVKQAELSELHRQYNDTAKITEHGQVLIDEKLIAAADGGLDEIDRSVDAYLGDIYDKVEKIRTQAGLPAPSKQVKRGRRPKGA